MLGARWTEERVEQLKVLHAEKLTCSQIAAELGGISRNAVIGKLTRLGLAQGRKFGPRTPKRRSPPQSAKIIGFIQRPYAAPRAILAPPEPELDLIESIIPLGQRCTLLQLNDSKCRWPIWTPGHEGFYFCGGAPVDGVSYCGFHTRVAFQPASGRRRDARWAGGQMRSL